MYLSHKIKLKPTEKQRQMLAKTAGTCRYVYNWAIDEIKRQYQEYKDGIRSVAPNSFSVLEVLTKVRDGWLKETNSTSQNRAVIDAWTAYKNFFKNSKWKYPAYKKKSRNDSFYLSNQSAKWFGNRISILRVGRVKLTETLRFTGKIIKYTVSREGDDWFISVTVDTDIKLNCDAPESTVGIDVGLKHPATTSDGEYLEVPKKLKELENKKKRIQKQLDRAKRVSVEKNGKSYKDYSNNGKKKIRKLRRVQSRINNIRKDITHKFTTSVCKSHDTIVVETLKIGDLIEGANKQTTRSFSTSMMWRILEQLRYKAKHIVNAPRFFPSSKLCSRCGFKKEDLSLSERVYVCHNCGLTIERDLNAAINLKKTPWVTGKVSAEK